MKAPHFSAFVPQLKEDLNWVLGRVTELAQQQSTEPMCWTCSGTGIDYRQADVCFSCDGTGTAPKPKNGYWNDYGRRDYDGDHDD